MTTTEPGSTVVSSGKSKGKLVKKIVIVVGAVLLLAGVFAAGMAYGKQQKTEEIRNYAENYVSSKPSQEASTGKIMGVSLTITGNADTDRTAQQEFLTKLDTANFKTATYTELAQVYTIAKAVGNTEVEEKAETVLKQRKAEFTKAQQEAMKTIGL